MPQPRLGACRAGAEASPGGARACWELAGSPGSEAEARLMPPRGLGKLEPSALFKFEANFAGAADRTDGRGRDRKPLQGQSEGAPLLLSRVRLRLSQRERERGRHAASLPPHPAQRCFSFSIPLSPENCEQCTAPAQPSPEGPVRLSFPLQPQPGGAGLGAPEGGERQSGSQRGASSTVPGKGALSFSSAGASSRCLLSALRPVRNR